LLGANGGPALTDHRRGDGLDFVIADRITERRNDQSVDRQAGRASAGVASARRCGVIRLGAARSNEGQRQSNREHSHSASVRLMLAWGEAVTGDLAGMT
jgi:hypothetical protein